MARFYRALETKYQAEIEEGLATLDLYFNNAVGVGEHPDIMKVLDSYLEKIDSARAKLDILKQIADNSQQNVMNSPEGPTSQ
jgi:hypothetical protein